MKNNSKLSLTVSCLIVLGLAAILMIAPVKRGMLFRQDYLPFFAKAGWFIVGVAVILIIEGKSIWQPVPDLALLAVAGLYGLSIFWARDKGSAIEGALRYCVYLGIFLSAKYASANRRANMLLRWSFVAGGAVAAAASLLAAAGITSYKDAVVGGRFYGTFQYPNALAAYGIFVSFILLHAWWEADNLEQPLGRTTGKLLLAVSGFAAFLVIILSYSKTTWLIFAATLAAYLFMLPDKVRGGTLARMATAFIPALIVNLPMAIAMSESDHGTVRKYMLIGAVLSLAAEAVRSTLSARLGSPANESKGLKSKPDMPQTEKFQQTHGRGHIPGYVAVLLVTATAALLIFGFTTEAGQQMMSKIVPEATLEKFRSISITDSGLTLRFLAAKNAFSIAKDHPFGTGAGGWKTLYHKYQTVLYWFTETGNHFAQVMVEAGFLGLAVYSGFWAFLFYAFFKAWRLTVRAGKGVSERNLAPNKSKSGVLNVDAQTERTIKSLSTQTLSTAFAVLALIIHSTVNFDLSIPAITIALFAAAGNLFATSHGIMSDSNVLNLAWEASKSQNKGQRAPKSKFAFGSSGGNDLRYLFDAVSLIILAVIIIVPANKYFRGIVYGSAAIRELVDQNVYEARELMYQAMDYDPHSPTYDLDLAGTFVHEYSETRDPNMVGMAKHFLASAREKSPYNPDYRNIEAEMLSAMDLYGDAADVAYEITEMIPLDIGVYEKLSTSAKEAMVAHGLSLLSPNITSETKTVYEQGLAKYAGMIKEIPQRLEDRKAGIKEAYETLWSPDNLNLTEPIYLALGQERFLEGDSNGALENLSLAAQSIELMEEAWTWLQALDAVVDTNLTIPSEFVPNEEATEILTDVFGMLEGL